MNVAQDKRSVWTATRGRWLGNAVVATWNARVPGTSVVLPMVQVTFPGHSEFYDDVETLTAHQTSVFAFSDAGREAAERIVRDVADSGCAVVWPHEAELIHVEAGTMHTVLFLKGEAA